MDFFDRQDLARRKSGLLVVYFVLAVVSMVVGLYAATVFALGLSQPDPDQASQGFRWFQPGVFAAVALVTLSVISLGSIYKTFELRGGGETVAASLGGRLVQPNTQDPLERQLLNVVEEMALAAGTAVPAVYVMNDENSINAFAAGFSPDDAVIGVNRGTLEFLTRDELQGVIAHEFSHILNGDMRFNLRLIGVLHGILLLALIGYYVLRGSAYSGRSSRSGKGGGAGYIMIIGLAALVIGYVGLFFGRLIKAAVSRQREYLADASAVQFTRNPLGIGGALKKIGGLDRGSVMESPEAESASHMFFGSAFKRFAHSPFATHPPLDERIRGIDPQFDGQYPKVQRIPARTAAAPPPRPKPVLGGATALGKAMGGAGPLFDRLPLDPALLIAAVGAPTSQHVNYSAQIVASLPEPVTDAAHEPFGARCVVFGLLLDEDQEVRQLQMDQLVKITGQATADETGKLYKHMAPLARETRLPMLEMAQSALRSLVPPQYEQFRRAVNALVEADQKISMFEFVVKKLLIDHLDRVFSQPGAAPVRFHSVSAVSKDIRVILSALAHVGHDDQQAIKAYAQAQQAVGSGGSTDPMLSGDECTLANLESALERLEGSSMVVKKRFLRAAAVCIAHDGQVNINEAELLRAIASSLDCPIPPIVPGTLQEK